MKTKYRRKIFYWAAAFAYISIAIGWMVIAVRYNRIHFPPVSWFLAAAYIAMAVREIKFTEKIRTSWKDNLRIKKVFLK